MFVVLIHLLKSSRDNSPPPPPQFCSIASWPIWKPQEILSFFVLMRFSSFEFTFPFLCTLAHCSTERKTCCHLSNTTAPSGSSSWPKLHLISTTWRSKVDKKLTPLSSQIPGASHYVFLRRVTTSKVLAKWFADESVATSLSWLVHSCRCHTLFCWDGNDWVLALWCRFKGNQPHIITGDISRWQQQPQSNRCTEFQRERERERRKLYVHILCRKRCDSLSSTVAYKTIPMFDFVLMIEALWPYRAASYIRAYSR